MRKRTLITAAGATLLAIGCASGEPKGPNRDFSAFDGSYVEISERQGRPCRASVDCDSVTDRCRIKIERRSWGKDSEGPVVEFKPGLLKISNEAEMEGKTPVEGRPVIIQEATVTKTGDGYLISVSNITKRPGRGSGARSRMRCGALSKRKPPE